MSFRDFRQTTIVSMFVGVIFLCTGIAFFLASPEGTMAEKVGLVLFTCGAMFVGIAFAVWIGLKMK